MEALAAVPPSLEGTHRLKSSGILDAYETVLRELILNGWPGDKSIFDHAAYQVLKFENEHKE